MRQPFIFAIALLALGGCGASDSNSSTAPGGSKTATSQGPKLKVVFIAKNTGNPYFDQVNAGFKSPPPGTDIDFDAQAPATADATAQIPIIKDQIQRGVDIIAISADSPDALNETLDQARAKGITVVTVDSDLTGNETHRDLGVLQADSKAIGVAQLDLMSKLMGGQGDFAILSAKSDAPNQNAWIAAMKDAMKDPKYAKLKLLTIVYGDDEPQKSSTETEALLAKYPTLKGILSPTSVGLAAAAQVLENAGRYPGGAKAQGGGIFLTGLSTPNQMKKAVQKGVVQSFQLWDPADMGSAAAYLAVQLHGKKVEAKPGTSVDVPGKGKLTIGDKGAVYAAPMLTFDKSNIDKYNF